MLKKLKSLFSPDKTVIQTYSDGSKYVGEYKDGKMHGQGTGYDKYGNVVGTFSNGVLK